MAHNNAAAAVNHQGEAGLKLPETSSRCVTEGAAHNFEINNYTLLEGMGVGKYITSSTFTVGGYDWNIRFYPDGNKEDSAGYASVYLFYVSEPKPQGREDEDHLNHAGRSGQRTGNPQGLRI
jgi:speckle-type POZ protein